MIQDDFPHVFFSFEAFQVMVIIGGLGPGGFGYLGSSYERDGYLGVPLESQTTNPNHPFIIWVVVSNIFYFHPYLEKRFNLTNIFQTG